MTRAGLLATLFLIAVGGWTSARAEGTGLFHFELSKSAPEAGAEVGSPSEIRLWFTQVPQDATTSIRLIDGAGDAVHTSDVMQDDEDGQQFSVMIHGQLPSGEYTVAWRAMGEDGHVVRGDFTFSVTAR